MSDLLDDIALGPRTSQRIVLVTFSADELEHLGFLMQLSPEVAIVELLHDAIHNSPSTIHRKPSPNGAHGTFAHVCSSCGTPFQSNRRPLPGKKSWCTKPECKKVAAAERAQSYRDRKSKEER